VVATDWTFLLPISLFSYVTIPSTKNDNDFPHEETTRLLDLRFWIGELGKAAGKRVEGGNGALGFLVFRHTLGLVFSACLAVDSFELVGLLLDSGAEVLRNENSLASWFDINFPSMLVSCSSSY
jgi:hypothetical protein